MEELYKKADKINFIPNNLSISWKNDPYLWMCELQKWLMDVYEIYITVEFWKNMDHDTEFQYKILKHSSIKPLWNKSNKNLDILEDSSKENISTCYMVFDYNTCLKNALLQAINLIKK